ncbi:MAG TPA: hypothetical protein VF029_05385 [Actinomycetota bacterium]
MFPPADTGERWGSPTRPGGVRDGQRPRTAREPKGSRGSRLGLARHGGADKTDAILASGGWDLLAQAHAWYDPSVDEEGNDPPREKGAYKLPHHELIDGRLHYEEFDREPPLLD